MTTRRRTVEIRGGLSLATETFGEGGPPLLLVMGIGAQMILWDDRFCRALADAGFTVVRFDNRDVGRSTWLSDRAPQPAARTIARALAGRPLAAAYTLEDMADDGLALIDALGLGPAHVMGASMGGMIAQLMALRGAGRIRSLISVMSSPGGRRTMLARPKALRALLARQPPGREGAGEHFVRVMRAIGSPDYPRDAVHDRTLGCAAFDRGSNPAGFLRQLAAIMASGGRREALRGLRVPTLVIHGAADPLILPRWGRETARLIPNARLMMIDGMGHDLPHALQPQLVEAIAEHARRAEAVVSASG